MHAWAKRNTVLRCGHQTQPRLSPHDLIEATLETPGLVGVDRFSLQEGKARMLFIIIELYYARVHRIWKSEPRQRIISVQKYIERIFLHVFEKIKLKNWY